MAQKMKDVNGYGYKANLPLNSLIPFSNNLALVQSPKTLSERSLNVFFLVTPALLHCIVCRNTEFSCSLYCCVKGLQHIISTSNE